MGERATAEWSAREAMASIAEVTRRDDALKARTEGLTWVIWGMGNAGAALTYVALSPDLSIEWWMPPLAALWILASLVVSAGLWRSAALPFRPGFTLRRGLAFFLAWPLLLSLLAGGFMSVFGWELVAQAKLLATGALLLAFAGIDPLRFTATGRATAAALGVVAIAAAAFGLWLGLTGAPGTLFVGGVLGVSWTAAGAVALFRG